MIRSTDYHYTQEDSIHALLKCPHCTRPFVDPVRTKDDKQSCRSCITSEDDHQYLIPITEKLLRDMLDGLQVKCIICGEEDIRRVELEQHIKSKCSKRIIVCPAIDLKCSWMGSFEELAQHLKSCPFESLRPIFTEILAENIELREQIKQNRICYDEQQREIEKLKKRDAQQNKDDQLNSQENIRYEKELRDQQWDRLQTELQEVRTQNEILLLQQEIHQNRGLKTEIEELKEKINRNNGLHKEVEKLKEQSIQQNTLCNELRTEFNRLKQLKHSSVNQDNELQNQIQQMKEQYNQQKIQYEQFQVESKQLLEFLRKHNTQTLQLQTQDEITRIKQLCNHHDIQIKLLARKKCVIPASTVYSNVKLEQLIEKSGPESEIDLDDKQLTAPDMDVVCKKAIVDNKCKKLRLETNQITAKGATILASALYSNTTLMELHLSNNRITDTGVHGLSQALSINNFTLRQLYLHSNNITDEGAEYLAEMLKTNKTITTLGLGFNQIGDHGVQLLAHAITYYNEKLEGLYLSSNKLITDKSIDSLIELLNYNLSLKELWLNNCSLSANATGHLRQIVESNANFILDV